MSAVALVDYDNVRAVKPERTQVEVESNLAQVVAQVHRVGREELGTAGEIEIRLYGGWVNEKGHYTRNAQWMFSAMRYHRGRREGILIKPQLITSLSIRPGDHLVGTFRAFASPPGQKMVDGMIMVDALHYSDSRCDSLMIFSDDDDLVPAAVTAAMNRSRGVRWIRVREDGRGLNDSLCKQSRIAFGVLGG